MSRPAAGPSALADLLRLAVAARRSIAFTLHRGEAPLGCVMVVRGRVAWAVSREQPVMLGDYLVRLGKISRAQLATATDAYRSAGGRRKLGAVLEELGYVSRPVLRQCLLLHARAALRALLRHVDLRIAAAATAQQEDEALLFDLDEVLPPHGPPAEAGPRPACDPAALQALFAVPGYLASAVAGADGALRSAHASRQGVAVEALALHAAALLDAADHLGHAAGLEAPAVAVSRHGGGAVLAAWLERPRRLALVLLDRPDGEAAAAAALTAAAPALLALDGLGSGADLARDLLRRAETPQAQVEAVLLALQLRIGELRSRGESPRDFEWLEGELIRPAARREDPVALLARAVEAWGRLRAEPLAS